jgi:glycosyltransferase involved in cell wall biosynthesis
MGIEISIIIPTRNEEDMIGNCLDAIKKSNFPQDKLEIILVDAYSEDKTRTIAESFSAKFYLEPKPCSPGGARNFGAQKSKGNILIFLDADQIVYADCISEIHGAFENKNIDAVIATELTKPFRQTFWSEIFFAEKVAAAQKKKFTAATAYRRTVFEMLGGFDPKLGHAEVEELGHRFLSTGHKQLFVESAKIIHDDPATFKEFFTECLWRGRTLLDPVSKIPRRALEYIAAMSLYFFVLPSVLVFLVTPFFSPLSIIASLILLAFIIRSLQLIYSAVKGGAKKSASLFLPAYKILRGNFMILGLFQRAWNKKKSKN